MAAYRPYVLRRLEAAGLPPVDEAIDRGAEWLAAALRDLLELPYREQRRSPLEVFQEAMSAPTEALSARGIEEVARDEVTVAALPGDRFGLAPASSQELGESAWAAHLAWGAAKAVRMKPTAIVLTRNLLDRSRIEEAAEQAGYRPVMVPALPAEIERHAVGMVDLEHPGADEAIRRLADVCGRVVAFGPHVDDLAMTRARSLGASDAVPRSRFFGSLETWFAPVA